MYTSLPAFVLGFHGCDRATADAVVCGHTGLLPSQNDYDWLGHGIYFWKNDPDRAYEYAELLKQHPKRGRGSIQEPAVLGAVMDLGHCLNLMETTALRLLRGAYDTLIDSTRVSGCEMPENCAPITTSSDLLLRRLDCAVIEILHKENTGRSFDTVRGLFFEGEDLYPNAGLRTKHIQIGVRNTNCIKGYFLPRRQDSQFPML